MWLSIVMGRGMTSLQVLVKRLMQTMTSQCEVLTLTYIPQGVGQGDQGRLGSEGT